MSGAEGTRTPDPHTASVVRYQLRHSPKLPEKVIKHPGTDLIEIRLDPPDAIRRGAAGSGRLPASAGQDCASSVLSQSAVSCLTGVPATNTVGVAIFPFVAALSVALDVVAEAAAASTF